MIRSARVLVVLPAVLLAVLSGCSPPKTPPPVVDPTKEQIIILQKQLLELQNAQNETRKTVDEQAAAISSLSSRLNDVEARRTAAAASPGLDQKQSAKSKSAPAKRTAKSRAKKKPVRRQEQ